MGKQKLVTVKGSVILSTIKTMESFGDIGNNVLLEHGLIKINKDDDYPYELRNELHKTILDRFGEIALTAFGFSHAESFQPLVLKETQQEYLSNIKYLDGDVIYKNNKALKNIFICLSDSIDKNIRRNSQNEDYKYGASLELIEENKFQFSMSTASVLYQKAFFVGVLRFHLARLFEKYWKYELTIDEEQVVEGYGYTKLVFSIHFRRKVSELSQSEIVTNRKMQIRDLLIRSVLQDAERQKKESNQQKTKVENLLKHLGKYTPPQIKESLEKGDYDTEITTRRKKLTIFFSDIVNFTSTSEGLQPEDLTKYLNEYFSEMTRISLDCGATIDKYIGDAMMVFFGDPQSRGERGDARACVEMALKMQERVRELQIKWRNEGFADPFQVRIGMNTGYCNVGNFGSDQRLTYTIIGGEVNIAQRLEANADAGGILMSYETYAHARDLVKTVQLEPIKMKGINREIKIFSVLGRPDKGNQVNVQTSVKNAKKEVAGHDSDEILGRLSFLERKIELFSQQLEKISKR